MFDARLGWMETEIIFCVGRAATVRVGVAPPGCPKLSKTCSCPSAKICDEDLKQVASSAYEQLGWVCKVGCRSLKFGTQRCTKADGVQGLVEGAREQAHYYSSQSCQYNL